MKKQVLLGVCVLGLMICLASAPAHAQDVPKVEIFGGYSFLRFNSDAHIIASPTGIYVGIITPPPPTAVSLPTMNLHGWHTSVGVNFNRWLGLAGDFTGNYGTPNINQSGLNADVRTRVYSYVFGPRVSFRGNERVTPFVHVLVGGAHLSLRAKDLTTGNVSDVETSNGFAMVAGGGVDVKVGRFLAVRLGQVDYLFTRLPGESSPTHNQHNFRYSAGVVFRFGMR